jgi:hypothetical protein
MGCEIQHVDTLFLIGGEVEKGRVEEDFVVVTEDALGAEFHLHALAQENVYFYLIALFDVLAGDEDADAIAPCGLALLLVVGGGWHLDFFSEVGVHVEAFVHLVLVFDVGDEVDLGEVLILWNVNAESLCQA